MRCALLLLLFVPQDPEIDDLIKQLDDESAVLRDQAIRALIKAGDKAIPRLKARKSTADGPLRKTCSELIETIAIPERLRGVLPPVTRVNLDARDRSLRDVLAEFQVQTRMPMKLGRASESPRWPKVTVRVEDMAPLEALNAICRAAKHNWYIPDEGGFGRVEFAEPNEIQVELLEGPEIRFSPGDYDKPRLFIRHYELEVWEIVMTRSNDFKKGRTRGELSIGLFWPAGVKPHSVEFEVTSAVDNLGNDLLEGNDDPGYPKGPRKEVYWNRGAGRFYHRNRLKVPDPKTRTLASVRGKTRLFYLLKTKSVTFDAPEKAVGSRKEMGGISAHLVEFRAESQSISGRIRLEGGARGDSVGIIAHTEDGKKWGPLAARPWPDAPNDYGYYSYAPSKVTGLEVIVDTECAEDSFEFEFKDVPLP